MEKKQINNKKKPKYSILIPTYNKAKYLNFTLQSILNTDYSNFEVIISDDFSTDNTKEVLESVDDKRIKIIQPPCKLTQTKNYEFLLTHASGEWVTILGDDDGILPNFFSRIDNYLEKFSDIEAIHTKPAIYYWEDIEDLYGDRVCDYQNYFEKPKLRDSKKSLLMSLAGLKFRTSLPMIYTTGLIKSSLMNKIKKKSNNFFFHSVIPDYYSMIAIMFETEKYLEINEPLFWVGVSKYSTGRGTKIYEDTTTQNYYFINKNLGISEKISTKLHNAGISSIYFFECILKHPYIGDNWKSKFIKYIVYSSSEIIFEEMYNKMRFRLKINVSKKEFKKEIYSELIKNNLSKKIFIFIKFFLYLMNLYTKFLNFNKRAKNFIIKRTLKYPIVLVTKDRNKYNNIIDCNIYIEKKLKTL